MDQKPTATRTCPECGSSDYVFRGRKKVAPKQEEQGPVVETKYICKACGCEWKVRVPV